VWLVGVVVFCWCCLVGVVVVCLVVWFLCVSLLPFSSFFLVALSLPSSLLQLADNFENHISIAEEGGIQALLRLARARSTDEELQYKAALTVGHLASNAVRLLPGAGASSAKSGKAGGVSRSKAGDRTREYLEKALKKTR
jgi:hypothetical protein